MSDLLNAPPLTKDFKDEDDDGDDNEDLFISAMDSHNKTTEDTLKSSHSTMEDLMAEAGGDEINLDDDYPTSEKIPDIADRDSDVSLNANKGFDKENIKATISASSTVTHTIETPVVKGTGVKLDVDKANGPSDHFIEIKVGEGVKVGDGMGSFVTYRVLTKTNLPYFRKNMFAVSRRFSDFLGLRDKLSEKHCHLGRIVPPAPEKNTIGTAKIKISKEENVTSTDFIVKRCASLERFINRVAAHQVLKADPDFREFLELDAELPKATNTSALSGAGVKRLFNRVGDTVNKMTFRMDESDPNIASNPIFNIEVTSYHFTWFEEKQHQIDSLDQQLKKLYASVEALIHHRKELTISTGLFAKSTAMLCQCEEYPSLKCALSNLAETEEKIEQLYADQVTSEFFCLSELVKDYICLIASVKDVFHQRVKVFQTWQHAQQTLTKKREIKAKLELAGKSDKVPQANEEVVEWEAKVNRGQEEFETISKTIKQEVERFEISRVNDFKVSIIKYMECLLDTQQQCIKYWEAFLPEARSVI